MYAIDRSDALEHHGILGQKWGVRRYQNANGSLTSAGRRRYNENYKPEQIRRDIAVYGKHGAKRISKSMDEGIPISGARSIEAARFHKAESASRTGRKVGKVVGLVAGLAGGAALGTLAVKAIKEGKVKPFANMKLTSRMQMQEGINFFKTEKGSAIIKAGAAALGAMLGTGVGMAVGKNAPLAAKGYTSLAKHNVKINPSKQKVKIAYTEKKSRSERDKQANKEMEKMGYSWRYPRGS